MATVTGLTAARMLEIEAASVIDGEVVGNDLILTKFDQSTINAGNVRGRAGVDTCIAEFFGDSRCNPDLSHTPEQAYRWTSRVAHALGAQQRNRGIGGACSLGGDAGDQPIPRAMQIAFGAYGPGYDYADETTQRKYRAALACLIDAYNIYKWPLASNPRVYDTWENCLGTWAKLNRADWAFPVGSGIAAPHWGFGAGWNVAALNNAYGVGPCSRLQASGNGTFTFNMAAGGADQWRGGKLTIICEVRKDVDDTPSWQYKISASRPGQNYGVVFDSTGATSGLPALGVDGTTPQVHFTIDTPAGSNETITFTVEDIETQCTIMGAVLEAGTPDSTNVPTPLVLFVNQPRLIASPDATHPEITNAVINILNTRMNAVAASFSDGRVGVVDIYSIINGQATGGTKYFKDNVHYSNLGHAVIAERVLDKISNIGLKPTYDQSILGSYGIPDWMAVEGDRVWDRDGNRLWVHKDDPLLASPNSDFSKNWVLSDAASYFEVSDVDYTLQLEDNGRHLISTAGSPQTIRVPARADVKFPVGARITIRAQNTNSVVIDEDPGVVINARGDYRSISQLYGLVVLVQTDEDVWSLTGDLINTGGSPVITEADVQAIGDSRWKRKVSIDNLVPSWAARLDLLGAAAYGALSAVSTPTGMRFVMPDDGEIVKILFQVGVRAGNYALSVYDTGDAVAGSRTKLWGGVSAAMSGLSAQQWNSVSPTPGSIPVVAGQHVDVLLSLDDIATATIARASVISNYANFSGIAELDTPDGADAKLGFKYPQIGAVDTWDNAVTEANVSSVNVFPIMLVLLG